MEGAGRERQVSGRGFWVPGVGCTATAKSKGAHLHTVYGLGAGVQGWGVGLQAEL